MPAYNIDQIRAELAKKINIQQILLIVSVVIGVVFIILCVLTAAKKLPTGLHWIDFLVFALLAMVGPYGFYMSMEHARIKDIERRLPDFLRDVAEAGRFGMTLADAIIVASKGRYGRLTGEIKKMAAQIKWGIPATEALRLFAERVSTPMVGKITAIIIKSSDAGGNVADVLGMVSHAAKEDTLMEDERRIAMSTYVAVVYIAFFVFLVTILILNATFLPKMEEAAEKISKSTVETGLNIPTMIKAGYVDKINLALWIAALVHAVGDGVLAGVLENGKVSFGLRHSFIMMLIGYLILRGLQPPK